MNDAEEKLKDAIFKAISECECSGLDEVYAVLLHILAALIASSPSRAPHKVTIRLLEKMLADAVWAHRDTEARLQ
jgi:hypothetical protein